MSQNVKIAFSFLLDLGSAKCYVTTARWILWQPKISVNSLEGFEIF